MYIQFKAGQNSLLLNEKFFALAILPLLFLLITGLFFKFSIMSPLWGLVYLLSFAWWGLTFRQTLEQITRWRLLFILPLIALLSVIWSTQPLATLNASIQFAVSTLIAVRLANTLTTKVIVFSLLFATSTGVILSLASPGIGAFWPIYENNGAFIGVYIQKTVAGVAFALCAISLISFGAMHRRYVIPTVFAILLFPLVLSAQSVSALLVYAFVPLVIGLSLLGAATATFRATLLFGLFTFFGVVLTVIWLDDFDLSAALLEAAGKSPTLTGRTDIWETGFDVWLDYPLTGVGFAAFWQNPMFSEVVGYIHATVDPRLKGFHNVYIESLVTTGLLGFLAALIVYVWTLLRCISWYISTGSAEALFWLIIVTVGLSFGLTDNALFAEHEQFHIFCVMAYVFSGQRPVIKYQDVGN